MRRSVMVAAGCAAIVGLMAGRAQAQVLHTLESGNSEPSGHFGYSVSGAGDVNGDGRPDVIVGADGEDGGAGRAYVFDGDTGGLLHTLVSPNPEVYGNFGYSVSGAGDVNGDGSPDVIVGAWNEAGGAMNYAGRAYVFSGATGALLHTLVSPNAEEDGHFGVSVSGAGDVNNDGSDDVIVGASGEAAYARRAYVFSGATGALLYTLVSPNPQASGAFGGSVSGARDVNGDGRPDVVVGALGEAGGASNAGRVYIFSGDGSLLDTLVSPNPEASGYFGVSVSGAGDASGDGSDDVIVGAYWEDGGAPDAGGAYIFSGNGSGLLYTLVSPNPETYGNFGWSVSGAGDVNSDGSDDVIVGAWWEAGGASYAGRAYVFSGDGGGLLCTLVSPNPQASGNFGCSVSGAGDVNGDGSPDVIVGAWNEAGGAMNYAGRAYVFSGAGVPVELASLAGSFVDGAVRLDWTWTDETDHAGFNVYRSEEPQTQGMTRINTTLIGGGSYLDTTVLPGRTYYYWLEDVDVSGLATVHGPVEVTAVGGPSTVWLAAPRPNPTSGPVTVRFCLPRAGEVSVALYNMAGRKVASLAQAKRVNAGWQEVGWEPGEEVLAAGRYVCKLSFEGVEAGKPVVVVR